MSLSEDLLKQSSIFHPDMLEALLAMQEDLQGNILKCHGRNYSVHLFLKFDPTKIDKAKVWIRYFAENVTSAKKQREQSLCYQKWLRLEQRGQLPPGMLFANFLLSAKGYQTLLELECTNEENIELFFKKYFPDNAFRWGMRNDNAREQINDPPLDKWDEGFGKVDIHALVLLADDNYINLGTQAVIVENEVNEFAEVIHIEVGKVFRRNDGKVIEHFGFVDGISQPLFYKNDIDEVKVEEGTDKWDPSAPLELVLVKDPLSPEKYSFGSYFVYRKLQQHVDHFKQKIEELARYLDVTPEMAGAFVVGRFKDGTPVTRYEEPQSQSSNSIRNNFDYQGDTHGTRCPFHAHIRKTNPRDEVPERATLEQVKSSRIARRGISYSYQKNKLSIVSQLKHLQSVSIDTISEEEVGLLFMCFQKSIDEQFIRLQFSWANSTNFPTNDTGLDPVIGQGEHIPEGEYQKGQKDGQHWSKGWDENPWMRFDFSDCVQMKGGEYFFAPSISFLKHLPDFQFPEAPAESS